MANLKTSLELDIKPFIDAINRAANSLKKIDDVNVKFNRSDFAKLESALKRIPSAKNITTKVLGEAETIRDLNQIEKNVKQIPNAKNININVDKNSSGRISQQLGGLTNQTSKLGTGLTGAFGGAAVGAAVAAFAYKAGRALISAGKTADELGDQLDLAFSQAGFTGNQLEEGVKGAQKFSGQLADDFGVAEAETTKILARVISLTGFVGKPAEEITKAVIGIEKASDGAISAQKAIQFFTKSLGGDPEAEAALNMLTAKFPALAVVINSTATASEKAVQINEKLIGTFDALARDAKTGFALFDRIGERLTLALGEGVNKSLDVFAPLLQSLSTGIGDLSGPIAEAFESLNASFLEPLVQIIQNFVERFQKLNTEGTATTIFFGILEVTANSLLFVFEALGEITLGVVEILMMFGPEVKALTKLFVDASKTGFAVALMQIKGIMQGLVSISGMVRVGLDLIYKGLDILGNIVSAFDSELVGLIKNFDFFAFYIDLAKKSLEGLVYICTEVIKILVLGLKTSILGTLALWNQFKNDVNSVINVFNQFSFVSQSAENTFKKIGNAALLAIPGLGSLLGAFNAVSNAYQTFKTSLKEGTKQKDISLVNDVGEALRARRGGGSSAEDAKNQKLAAEAAERLRLANLKATGGGGGGGGKTTTETQTEKEIKAYQAKLDFLTGKYATGVKRINLLEEEANLKSNIGLTALEKLEFKQQQILAGREKQKEIEKEFLKAFGLTTTKQTDGLKELRNAFKLLTTDLDYPDIFENNALLQDIAIKLLPAKASKEDIKKFLDETKKSIDDALEQDTAEAALKVEFRDLNLKLNKETLNSELDDVQSEINLTLANIAIGIPATVGQDIFKETLKNIIKRSKEFSGFYKNQITELELDIKSADFDLSEALEKNKETPNNIFILRSIKLAREDLLKYRAQLAAVSNEQRDLNNVTNKSTEALNGLGQGFVNAGLASEEFKFRAVDAFQKIENAQLERDVFDLEIKLNTEGASQALIAIQKDFLRATRQLDIDTKSFIKKLAIQYIEAGDFSPLGTVTGAFAIKAASEGAQAAQEEAKKALRIQKQIAENELKSATDVFFSLRQALQNNLASVIAPDTTGAKSNLDKKKKEIDSELELLKAKLDIENGLNADNLDGRSLSYQEYTEKILDLEKEKNDAIKVYDDEVNAKRLEGLQRIATEALPAINNALLIANATLTDSLKQGTDSFTDQANQALEVIGLVAAQSLLVAIQQAKSMEEVLKIFLKNVVAGLLKVLQIELIAAIMRTLFNEVEEKGLLGLVTGALLGAALTTLFAVAQAKINTIIDGFSEGGYTGNANTNAVAGVVHGQEFVINAEGTKRNRAALEFANNGGNLKDFFKGETQINTFVDTKNMSNSINSLAFTMDSRLSSLETTVDRAIRQSSTTMRSQNGVDVSVYSDPGTTIKYMKKIGKIKGLS